MDQLAREILERGIYLDVAYRYRSSRWEAYDYAGDLIADGTDKGVHFKWVTGEKKRLCNRL